jgi:endonuclease YncB( thermonuclease family)
LVFLIAFLLFVPPIADWANGAMKSYSRCDVMMVMDGDTLKMTCPDTGFGSGRIIGFDAPEKNARCISEYVKAIQATWALRIMLWRARTIDIRPNGKDRYDRTLISVYVNGKDVAPAMIGTELSRSYNGGRRGSWCE